MHLKWLVTNRKYFKDADIKEYFVFKDDFLSNLKKKIILLFIKKKRF
jgi:hypothetical protein